MKENGNIKVIEPTDDYKRIHKSIIRNKNIDCLTLGIYCKIVLLGAEWQLNIKGLSKILGISDNKVRISIGILEREGYIKREANYHDNKLDGWVYNIYPEPIEKEKRSKAGYKKYESDLQIQCCADSSLTQNQTRLESDKTENGEDNNNKLNKYIDYINNNTNNINKKNITKKERQIINYTSEFEQAFIATGRKGSKKNAFKRWQLLSEEDKEKAFKHIPFYYHSNDVQYLKDFEGYLNGRYFENVVYGKKGNILYDPDRESGNIPYTPVCEGSLSWNDYHKCYLYVGFWDGKFMPDGYTDENRPNGASVMLHNGRGTIVWNKEQKKWELS